MRINSINISLKRRRSSGSSWTGPQKPLAGESVNFWAKGRNGLTMPDAVGGNDIKILPSYLYKPTGNEYAYIADNGGLDIGANNFTIITKVKGEDKTNFGYIAGKGIDASVIGRYALYYNATTGFITFNAQPSGENKTINSVVDVTSGWHVLLADVNVATSVIRLFIDNVQIGADVSYTGTFSALNNIYNFYIGGDNSAPSYTGKTSHADTLVFHRLLSAPEMANCMLGVYPTNAAAHWTCEGRNKDIYDTKGTYNLTGVNLGPTKVKFSAEGSQYLLDNGWSLWQKAGAAEERVPYGSSTTALSASGYGSQQVYSGSTIGINMAPCLVGFNESGIADVELEIYDRSNTTRQTALSRASGYYDATSLATKSRYYIDEISNYGIRKDYFTASYQYLSHVKLAGVNSDLSIIEFFTFATQKTTSQLSQINIYKRVVQSITIGVGKDAVYINAAIRKAFDGSTITIDAGTYLENIDLTRKELHLIGLGAFGQTIIHYSIEYPSAVSTLNLATNSTFNNILFDKREFYAGAVKPIVNISACKPVFTTCQVGREIYVDGSNSQNPMTISNGSIVNMTGCKIAGTDTGDSHDLLVTDTSKLFFEGTSFFACLKLQDTAEATINTDYLFTNGNNDNQPGIVVENDAKAYIMVNIREIAWNSITRLEYSAGIFSVSSFRLFDNGYLQLSGNQITGGIRINGPGNVILFKDIISILGKFWVETTPTGSAGVNTLITFDNCQIVMDCDSDDAGFHLIEETKGGTVNLINGTRLEFSGHNGNWFTMGSPIVMMGKLVIRNSQVIDNCNDNIPYGANYGSTIFAREVDFEDAVITNQNWDHVGVNTNLTVNKEVGRQMKIRLKNVVFNNSEINSSPIAISNTNALDVDDYLCEENVTYNSTAAHLNTNVGNPVIILVALKAACPA